MRTLRQIISDDSASSSSLDSSSSATSGTSGVSERNTRLSLLWTSRLQRPGQDSDSAGEVSSVHSSGGDANTLPGGAESRAPTLASDRETNSGRPSENAVGSEYRHLRGDEGQGSGDDEAVVHNTDLPTAGGGSQSDRAGSLWGYYSSQGVIHTGRRGSQGRLNTNNNVVVGGNVGAGYRASSRGGSANGNRVDNAEANSSEGRRSSQNETTSENRTLPESTRMRTTSSRRNLTNASHSDRNASSSSSAPSRHGAALDCDEDLAIPGPSGLSGTSRSQSSLQTSHHRFSNSSTIDPQFGVQLLSGHIENMQRICRLVFSFTVCFYFSRLS